VSIGQFGSDAELSAGAGHFGIAEFYLYMGFSADLLKNVRKRA